MTNIFNNIYEVVNVNFSCLRLQAYIFFFLLNFGMNRVEIIIVELKINDVLEFCWLYSCRSYMYMLLHLVANWIHCRSYQYLYKVWIDEKCHWSWELIVILNRWELLLAWMVWEIFMSSDELWIACQGAITPLWSPMNSHWHLLSLVCSLTH